MHSDWSAVTEDCGGWDQYTYQAVQIKPELSKHQPEYSVTITVDM